MNRYNKDVHKMQFRVNVDLLSMKFRFQFRSNIDADYMKMQLICNLYTTKMPLRCNIDTTQV